MLYVHVVSPFVGDMEPDDGTQPGRTGRVSTMSVAAPVPDERPVRVTLCPQTDASLPVKLELRAAVCVDAPGGGRWLHSCLRHSVTAGRFMVAPYALAPGTVVCCAPVHVLSVLEEWKKRVCASCFTVAPGRQTHNCAACDQAWYCSETCRARHAKVGGVGGVAHSLVCPALRKFPALKKLGKSNMAMLRLMLEVFARRHADTTEGDDFDGLVHHPPIYAAPKEEKEWGRACELFREALACCDWCPWRSDDSGGSGTPPSDLELHAVLSRLDSNCFGCYTEDGGPVCGHGAYLAAAAFNHSCAPNCEASSGVGFMSVVTQQAVAAGEELTIAYADVNLPRAARQKYLRNCYCFDCACTRCEAEAAGVNKQKLSYGTAAGGRGGQGGRGGGRGSKAGPGKQPKTEASAENGRPATAPSRARSKPKGGGGRSSASGGGGGGGGGGDPWFASLA